MKMELDDLKKIAPNLSKVKKEEGFTVPENYFETFRQRLDEKIHQEEKIPFFEKIIQVVRPQLALASLMLSVVVLGYIGVKVFVPEKNIVPGQHEIAQVLEDEIYYMDEAFILECFAEDNETKQTGQEISDELVDEIIDYLSEDGMSLDLILEDF